MASRVLLFVQGVVLAAAATLGMVLAFQDAGAPMQVRLLGVLFFLPAGVLLSGALAVSTGSRGVYWVVLLAHTAIVLPLAILVGTLLGEGDAHLFVEYTEGHVVLVIMISNAAAAGYMLRAPARHWFGLAPLKWVG